MNICVATVLRIGSLISSPKDATKLCDMITMLYIGLAQRLQFPFLHRHFPKAGK